MDICVDRWAVAVTAAIEFLPLDLYFAFNYAYCNLEPIVRAHILP